MSWLYLDDDAVDPNRVRQLVPDGWTGRVRTESGDECDAEFTLRGGFRTGDGEPVYDVVACEVP